MFATCASRAPANMASALLKSPATHAEALALLASEPGSAAVADKAGLLPLHEACRRKAPAAVVSAVVAAHPAGAEVPAIAATIDGYQSRVLARPDGALVQSKLGKRLEEEEAAA